MSCVTGRGLLVGVCIALGTALATGATASSADDLELRFDRLNSVYENLDAVVAPVSTGGVTIHLTSPEHRLELKSNSLRMRRLSSGAHRLTGTVRFAGKGLLHAEIDVGGVPATLEDRVDFPDQEQLVEADVRIETVENGYRVTAEQLPQFVEIEMRSRLGSELVAWCERLAFFIAGDAGCPDLRVRLARPRLPLPEPGASYVVLFDELTADERARIDAYLSGH